MGITLTSKTIKSTYQGLLKLSDNNPISTVYKTVTDGFGNDSALRISTLSISAKKLYSEMSASDILTDANGSVVVTRDYLGQFSYELLSNKGAPSGYVPLDANSKIDTIYLPPTASTVTTVNSLAGDVQIDLEYTPSNGKINITGGVAADIHLVGTYEHDQGVPAVIWVIQHNLDKHPAVTAVDTANTVVVGDVEYTDTNNLEITFNSAFSGYAYLN